MFQQDGARPHAGGIALLQQKGARTLPLSWPAQSPDMSPIEQLWQQLADAVNARGPYGIDELQTFVEEEFAAIPQSSIDARVASFLPRCREVVKSKGATIKP